MGTKKLTVVGAGVGGGFAALAMTRLFLSLFERFCEARMAMPSPGVWF